MIKQVDRVSDKCLRHLTGTNGLYNIHLSINRTAIGFSAVLMKDSL
ncbi:MAG: hypothetical protein GW809_07280 [Bacteroidetes bacterium]|nr:hypothetical protein [Bacteroidota bacterium]NCQ11932.1 hypothetical protein [Bacteroidota bacterium]